MGGDLPDIVILQALERRIHVTDDDGHMLEPAVIAVRGHGNRPARGWRNITRELNNLLTQPQMNDPHVRVEHALQLVVFRADNAKVGDFLEPQYFREKLRLAI